MSDIDTTKARLIITSTSVGGARTKPLGTFERPERLNDSNVTNDPNDPNDPNDRH
jgi:hypothetical protein